MANCNLEKLKFPPVGETLHKAGHCYCYLCSCGKHTCPSLTKRSLPNLANANSSYRRTYIGKHPVPSTQYVRQGELMHSKSPMELRTTGAETFVMHTQQGSPAMSKVPRVDSVPHVNLEAHSTYKDQFLDWKMQGLPPQKKKPGVTPSPVGFRGETTYKNNFGRRKLVAPPTAMRHSPEIYIGLKEGMKTMSTSRSAFKRYSPEDCAAKVIIKQTDPTPIEIAPVHFTTTYSACFQKAKSSKILPTFSQWTKARHNR